MRLQIDGKYFKDPQGRYWPRNFHTKFSVLTLRGVNLGSDAKNPVSPHLPSHLDQQITEAEKVSFIGAPFPLEEAGEHLGRIKGYGFNVVRFVFTWEALEHAGPYTLPTYLKAD